MSEEEKEKKSLTDRIFGRFRRDKRVEEGFKRLHEVGGLSPMFKVDDVEIRRLELREGLDRIATNGEDRLEQNRRARDLYFAMGSPWGRGLDDRTLAKKNRAFLLLQNLIGDMEAFAPDVFMCSLQMIHISWKEEDVTTAPPLLLETKTTLQPSDKRASFNDVTPDTYE